MYTEGQRVCVRDTPSTFVFEPAWDTSAHDAHLVDPMKMTYRVFSCAPGTKNLQPMYIREDGGALCLTEKEGN